MRILTWGSVLAEEPRVPHISLVFREMWDTTALDRRVVGATCEKLRFVVSHISRKTSEMWGTRDPQQGQGVGGNAE
jgi:hypothetical protein